MIGNLVASSERRVLVEEYELPRAGFIMKTDWTLSGRGVNHELDIETQDPHAMAAYGSRFSSDWSRLAGG